MMEPTSYGVRIIGKPLGEGQTPLKSMIHEVKKINPDMNVNIILPLEKKDTVKDTLKYEKESVNKSIDYARNILKI